MSKPVIIQDAGCKVYFGDGCLKGLASWVEPARGRVIVLCEKHAASKILPPLFRACPALKESPLYRLDATEPTKQIETLIPLWKKWLKDGTDRKTTVVNIGGGVLCDMGGFAASTYMRGLNFINVPTTLLAMADASVGGKTAVDLGETKNILGQFARPEAVFIDPVFLETLPKRQLLSGAAEILKMQCIANPRFKVETVEKIFTDRGKLLEALRFAVEKKAAITQKDFKEDGLRRVLNFGHTFGHAIEALSLERSRSNPHVKPLTHGEAVAQGMLCELYLSWQLLGFEQHETERFAYLVGRYYGQSRFSEAEIKKLLTYIKRDKKNKDGKIYPVLLFAWGKCLCDYNIDEREAADALRVLPLDTCPEPEPLIPLP